MKTLKSMEFTTELLRSGKQLFVTSQGSAIVQVFFRSKMIDTAAVTEGNISFGPFYDDVTVKLSSVNGPVEYEERIFTIEPVAKPPLQARRVKNELASEFRFLVASFFGTGNAIPSALISDDGIQSGTLLMDSGSNGRAWNTSTVSLAVGWYAFSFRVLGQSLGGGADSGLRKVGGTAIIGYGNLDVLGSQIESGGNGRYCSVFRVDTAGTIIYRLGVGINNNNANTSITVADIQLEIISDKNGLVCSEYVYPDYTLVTNTLRNISIDSSTRKVTQYTPVTYQMKPYSHILAVGDSRMDERTNIGGQLDILLASEGRGCAWHAVGGWKTTDVIGPTVIDSVTFTINKAINGTALTRFSSNLGGKYNKYDTLGNQSFDTLLIADLGVNDIISGRTAVEVVSNIATIANAGVAAGLNVIITDNNPYSGAPGWSPANQIVLENVNNLIHALCFENNYLFVEMYSALGDSTNPEKLSDGLGTTPNYSQDGIHLNAAGSILVAQRIKDATDELR